MSQTTQSLKTRLDEITQEMNALRHRFDTDPTLSDNDRSLLNQSLDRGMTFARHALCTLSVLGRLSEAATDLEKISVTETVEKGADLKALMPKLIDNACPLVVMHIGLPDFERLISTIHINHQPDNPVEVSMNSDKLEHVFNDISKITNVGGFSYFKREVERAIQERILRNAAFFGINLTESPDSYTFKFS